MGVLEGIILGVVQGLTEFLPISSTGHLILAREVLGLQTEYALAVDGVLHFATALAVLIYFRVDFARLFTTLVRLLTRKVVEKKDKVLFFAIVLGTIPAALFGFMLEGAMETVFRNALLVAGSLVAGSLIMLLAERFAKQDQDLTPKKGLWIGFFQVLALVPGMSRSGMTISGGLFFGLSREEAARFGFILAFPIILGAGAKKILELGSTGVFIQEGVAILASAVAAFTIGIFAMHYLIRYLRTHTLGIFIWYRILLAVLVVVFFYL